MQVRVQSAVQIGQTEGQMPHGKFENHAHKKVRRHLLHFDTQFTIEYGSSAALFGGQGGEHHKTSDKPPPAGVGSRDGLLYVYHTADCSPLWCVVGCVVLYRTRRRPLVRCRSPPNVQDSQKFLNDLEDKTMRYRIMDK